MRCILIEYGAYIFINALTIYTNHLCIYLPLATSAGFVTSPAINVKFGLVVKLVMGPSAYFPPLPFGTTHLLGLRVKPTTVSPSRNAW